jgi:hypothetical protein
MMNLICAHALKLILIFFALVTIINLSPIVFGQCRTPDPTGGDFPKWNPEIVSYGITGAPGFTELGQVNSAVNAWNDVLRDLPCPKVQFDSGSSFPALQIKFLTDGDLEVDSIFIPGFLASNGKMTSGEIHIHLNAGYVNGVPIVPAFDRTQQGYNIH